METLTEGKTATEVLDGAIEVLRATKWCGYEAGGKAGACILEAIAMGNGDLPHDWSDIPVVGTGRYAATAALLRVIDPEFSIGRLNNEDIDSIWLWNDGDCVSEDQAVSALHEAKSYL